MGFGAFFPRGVGCGVCLCVGFGMFRAFVFVCVCVFWNVCAFVCVAAGVGAGCVCVFGHGKAPARLAVCWRLRAGAKGVPRWLGLVALFYVYACCAVRCVR
jgi:hypothetical protein